MCWSTCRLLSYEQLADIEALRLSEDELGPALPFARLPGTVAQATAVYGPAWWATSARADASTSDRDHPVSPRGAHRDGPRESARYAYRGTIVGEASHPRPTALGVDPRCEMAPACRRWGLAGSCEDGPRFPGGEDMPEASPMGESGRGHRCSPRGRHRAGPRESARYGYRGTIVGEASHPGHAPPAADLAGAPAPGEVLRYMRPTAGAGPGTSRGGGHRQSRGGRAAGAGRRGRSSVEPHAAGSMATDAVLLPGVALMGLGVCFPGRGMPRRRTPMLVSRRSMPMRLTVAPRASGWLLAPPGPTTSWRRTLVGALDPLMGLMASLAPPLTVGLMPGGSPEPKTNRFSPAGGAIPPARWRPRPTRPRWDALTARGMSPCRRPCP